MNPKDKIIKFIQSLPDTLSFFEILDKVESEPTLYPKPELFWKNRKGRFFFVFAFFVSLLSLAAILYNYHHNDFNAKCMDLIIYALWLVVPPIWFLYEYIWLFPDRRKLDDNQMSDFKFTQELASKFWASLLVLFAFVLYYKYNHMMK